MHAQVFDGTGFQPLEVPSVRLGPGEVLVSIELATICGSDLHTVAGHRSAPTPLVLGHEQVGRVVELGPGPAAQTVDGRALIVGTRVVWGVAVDCGHCRYCLAGLPQKCVSARKYGHEQLVDDWQLSGGFASHAHLLARTPIVAVGEDLPATVLAPASCATATVMAAIESAEAIRSLDGSVVTISGCGMLGLAAIAVAVSRGARVVASDPEPARREAALGFGATAVADGTAAGLRAALDDLPGAEGGYAIALELSGARPAVETLLAAADIGAVLVLVGSVSPTAAVPLDPEAVVRRLLTVRGVHNYAPRHLQSAVEFLGSADTAAFAALVGPTFALADLPQAVELATTSASARVAVQAGPVS